jgi:hypothetical protein
MTAGRMSVTKNKEWFTPPEFMASVYEVLGAVSLDPCSAEQSPVEALTHFRLPVNNGLSESWSNHPTIFVNPPYGRDKARGTSIRDWLEKCSEAASGGSEVIALIPVAPNTRHWKEWVFPTCSRICFIKTPRFKFIGSGEKGAPMAVAAVYWGSVPHLFRRSFASWGAVVGVVQ